MKTLFEAILLVVLVMFVFLQSWRATLIPFIAVPVVLLGTFAILYALGFSINTMTLFGLVLATGLLVDDAIVVVENVERLMHENPEMTPRDATIASMEQIQMALVAIALVLSAVFLPMVFFGGSTGVIYRQFSATIVSAMALSVFIALTLSPAIAANILQRKHATVEETWLGRSAPSVAHALELGRVKFNTGFDRFRDWFVHSVSRVVDRKWLFLGIYAGVFAILILLFVRLPTGFLPTEDQGAALVQFRLPAGATMTRTRQVQQAVEDYFLHGPEKKNVKTYFTVAGGGQGAAGQNTGQAYLNLADYDKRKGAKNSADAIVAARFGGFPRPARRPGVRAGPGRDPRARPVERLHDGAAQHRRHDRRSSSQRRATSCSPTHRRTPSSTSVRLSELPDVASLKVNIDQQRVAALGLNSGDVNSTLSTAWGGRYVNDFIDRGRVKRVYVQGDAPYRAEPTDIDQWFVRNNQGGDGALLVLRADVVDHDADQLVALPRLSVVRNFGPGRAGRQLGRCDEHHRAVSPPRSRASSVAWAGQSYQERLSSGQAPILYGVALIVVFLCLAALYESWSIPVAVLLVIPLGLVGSIFFVTLRGLQNDVYLQVGLITTMGLSAKNAILMVEFAERAEREGQARDRRRDRGRENPACGRS